MIEYCLFPGGKTHVVTFSYDDGHKEDERLAKLFNKYKVKATFHLNGMRFAGMTDDELAALGERYNGHEIACHTYHHGYPGYAPAASVVTDTMRDRELLEKIAGYPVLGMSYPYGSYSTEALEATRSCGILYSRTGNYTKNFRLPTNFLEWDPTCHHNDAMEVVDLFIRSVNMPKGTAHKSGFRPLFFILGHSFEFRTEEDWAYMEALVEKLSGYENIWYATSMEIYTYMQAQKQLRISADEKIICNPTRTDVWVIKDREKFLCIKAGETLKINE